MAPTDYLFHKSVLVDEVLEQLNLQPDGVYIDATFGSGGHTKAILQKEPTCHVIGMDWDKISLDTYAPLITQEFGDRFTPVWGNFATLYKTARKLRIDQVNGVLADFGTSQMQIKERAGFSFNIDSPLDMRMSISHYKETAADIVNHGSFEKLVYIFGTYGEERFARKITRAIIEARSTRKFKTTRDLAGLIEKIMPRNKSGIHPATKVFQGLRIHINHELEHIKSFLAGATTLLADEGRIACISFHSLEDRIVKQYFRDKAHEGVLEIITPKAIEASSEEIAQNPSSRSAKLRVAAKVAQKK
jgi:16S rRNA (cytosine1402-N4)-methyltransferase